MRPAVSSLHPLAAIVTCVGLSACATGQGSFVGAAAVDRNAASAQEASVQGIYAASSNLVAVSGNALLPGSRRPVGVIRVSLAGQPLLGLSSSRGALLGLTAPVRPAAASSALGGATDATGAPRATVSTA